MKQLLVVILLTVVCVFPLWGQGAAENELLKLENDWGNAWVKGDTVFLDQLLATDFAGVGSDGTTYDKAGEIKEESSPEFTDKSFNNPDLKARAYGETGVVMGRRDLKWKNAGKPQHVETTFTDVFVKRDGRWQAVASQDTPLAKKAATASTKAAVPEKK